MIDNQGGTMARKGIEPGNGRLLLGSGISLGAIAIVLALALSAGRPALAASALIAAACVGATLLVAVRSLIRIRQDLSRLARLAALPDAPIHSATFVTEEVTRLACAWPATRQHFDEPPLSSSTNLTGSGLFDGPIPDLNASGTAEFSQEDLVAKLEPQSLRWLSASPALLAFLGWTEEELACRVFSEIVLEDDRDLAREQLMAAEIKGEAHGLIYRILTADGSQRVVELHIGVRFASGERKPRYVRVAFIDVTAKVRAGRELRRRTRELTRANTLLRQTNRELAELKDRYSDLYENAPALYFSLDDQGRFEQCNQTLLDTLGYRREEIIDRAYYATILEPGHRADFPAQFDKLRLNGRLECEAAWRRADGRLLNVSIQCVAIRAGDGRILTSRWVARDVSSFKVLEAALRERNDRLAGVVAELRRKNRELDEFSSGVSHDLQEPLRTLIAFSDFLLADYGDRLDETGREYICHLVKASRRMRRLIEDLLNLSRAGRVAAAFLPVDLQEVLDTCRADLTQLLRERQGELIVEEPMPTLWGDRSRLEQLLTNLISNGLKYHRPGIPPVVTVSARAEDGPEGPITLAVRDNGIGIDPQFHEKIFLLFRRLHAGEHEGTGAGLAICRKIVQAHRGTIQVRSEPEMGATFVLTLPGPPAQESRREPSEAAHV
ncbi:MAG: PAS domain S-box protein [Isosphaeraceae bacterium]